MADEHQSNSTVTGHALTQDQGDPTASTVRAHDLLRSGTTIGRYSIVRLVGEGGMGAVYEALHVDLEKRVAIKTLHRRIAGSPDIRARFLREGQAASKIRHEHVVDVYDVGVEGEIPYLVMEYLEGESLAALLAREGHLPLERIADLLVPVIAALAAAHDLGIIHRDLKPENVFLCEARGRLRPKVVDFGISKIIGEGTAHAITGTAALLGTPFYMSPEQAQNAKKIDARSDQYSLGVILYEAAVGKRPFGEATLYELLQNIVKGAFPKPREAMPELPREFEDLVLRAMSREPGDRYESVRELGRELLRFASEPTRVLFEDALTREDGERDAPRRPAFRSTPEPTSYSGASSTLGATENPMKRRPRWQVAAASVGMASALVLAWLAVRSPSSGPGDGVQPSATSPASAPGAIATKEEPAAAPPAASAPASEAAPAVMEKTIVSEPSGADVLVDGKRVGATPHVLKLDPNVDAVRVEIRARQHLAEERTIRRTDADETRVVLRRAPTRAGPARPERNVPELAPR